MTIINILSENILQMKENRILETRTTGHRLNAFSGSKLLKYTRT